MRNFFLSFVMVGLVSCASSEKQDGGQGSQSAQAYDDDNDENLPMVHPAAYAASTFSIKKISPNRVQNHPEKDFYYKDCRLSGKQTHFSRTLYFCQ
jgi:hypothetical protein